MPPAIRIQGVSKSYDVGGHDSLRRTLAARWRSLRHGETDGRRSFWALRDVSFDVEPGEAVGVIGANGAGKSTLLKILARITKPTEGRVELRARVTSLLEIGTGFHVDLTGRENVYLNGTILGMSGREIRGKLESIVEFAGVREFLDTPLKFYSSGMLVRLAFSVAAHLDPEILLLDEALAVGDASFHGRSFGKIQEMRSKGRTILIVSHDLRQLDRLAPRSVLLEKGRLVGDGPTALVVADYLRRVAARDGEGAAP